MTVKTPARFGASVKAVLLAGVSLLAISPAQASLVTSIPGGTTVTPPNNGTVPASFFSNTGPIQLGTGIGRDIVWSTNNPSAVGGYSGGYGLCSNGSWTGTPAYFGTNSPNNSETMTFSFNDANASAAGGFMNWGAGCFGSADFTIQAFDASNVLLESYTLNFSAPGTNNGQFFAISRPSADIKYFVIFGGFVVLRDFTFLSFLGCPVGVGNDTCLIDSTTNQATAIDALGGSDTLQVGGAADFNFDVAAIGTTFTNFETFEKTGASNVTLTGAAGTAANWDIQAGTLTASTGNNIFDTSNVNVGGAGTFALTASETIGSLSGSGNVDLGANTLTTGGNNTDTIYAGIISGAGGLTKTGTGQFDLSGANTYTGTTTVLSGQLTLNGGAAIADTGAVVVNGGALGVFDDETIGSLAGTGGVIGTANPAGATLTMGGNNATTTYSGVIFDGGAGPFGIVKRGTGNMTLSGNNSYTGTTSIFGGTLTVAGGNAIGNTSQVQISGGTLALSASETIGSLTGSDFVTLGGNTLTTGGNNLSFVYGGSISGTGGLTKIGTGNQGLIGTNTYTGTTMINAGVLTLGGGNAIANTGAVIVNAPGQLTLNGSETIGSLAGGGTVDLSGNTLTTGGTNASTSFLGTTTGGAGNITKVGTGVFTTLGLGNTGTNTVAAGTWNINGTVAGNMVVNSGAVLSGNANILGDLTLNVGSSLSPGNSPGTTSVGGNFAGGGTIFTEVQFNNAGAPVNGVSHDFLNIGGGVTGTTFLNVVAFAPSGTPAATTGNGIELVRVGGATTAGAFQLSAPLVFGGLQYTLNYLADYSGTLDGYFLQSGPSDLMHGEAAMLAAGQAMVAGCMMGEDALVGDGNAHRGRAWAKAGGGNRTTGADTGLDASNDYSCASGGVDFHTTHQLRLGLGGGYGTSESDVNTPAGFGQLDGDGGIVQLYAEFHSGDFFASLTGGWGVFDWTFDGPITAAASAQTDGIVGALQLGHTWALDALRLGAIGEIAYNDMTCSSDCLLVGTVASVDEWSYKGTLRADTTLSNGKIKPYLALSLADGGTNTATNVASLTTDTNALRFVAKGGASFMVGDKTGLFVNGGITEGLDNDIEGWDIGAGIKAMW